MDTARRNPAAHAVRILLLLGWCGVVWYLSDRPDPRGTVGIPLELPDWLLHGSEYAAGGFLARHALRPLVVSRLPVPFLFCCAWALLDEWHQSFVPGRDAAFGDVVADAVGAALGVVAHATWVALRAR